MININYFILECELEVERRMIKSKLPVWYYSLSEHDRQIILALVGKKLTPAVRVVAAEKLSEQMDIPKNKILAFLKEQ